MAGSQQSVARPHVACEITNSRVIGARSSPKRAGLELFSNRHLPPGTVVPALNATNVQDGNTLRSAISAALASVGGKSRDVIAILPDAAVRVLLLEFDDLPSKPKESEAVIRFRLKKSLPF